MPTNKLEEKIMKKKKNIVTLMAMLLVISFSVFGQIKPAKAADIMLDGKNFSKLMLKTCREYDKNNDNRLSQNEISKIKNISIEVDEWRSNRRVNLKGMEYMTGIKDFGLEAKSFKNMKFGDFKELNSFTLYCRSGIDKLSLKKAPNIKQLELGTTKGVIKSVDISNNKEIRKLELRNVKNIDIGNLKKLELLDCDRNIDISKNPKLEAVLVHGNVKRFDISANGNVKEFAITSKKLKALDLKKNKKLEVLDIYAPVKNLDLSRNTELEKLSISAPVKKLDLSKNKKLEYLYINAPVEKLDLSCNTNLKEIDIKAPVNNIDLSHNKKLKNVRIEASIKNINLSHNQKVEYLNINAPLESLDISMLHSLLGLGLESTVMEDVKLANDNIDSLSIKVPAKNIDLSDTPKLKELMITAPLESLDISMLHSLDYLELRNIAMKELKLVNDTIGSIGLSNNEFSEIDTSGMPNLVGCYTID